MDVNVASMFLTCRAVVPVMRDQGGGRIVNISSGTPFRGVPFLLHYVTSKGAIVALTRALGVEANVEVEVQEIDVQKGDYFLMCSDGLPDMVEDEDIHLTISTFSNDVRTVGEQLIKLTNDNGGRDNISAMLIRVAEPFGVPRGWLARFKALFR